MSILDHIQQRATGMYGKSDFGASPITEMRCEPTGNMRDGGFSTSEEYELSAKIAIRFWANKAQHREARKVAEQALLNRLYGETLALVNEAKKAVFDGDAAATIAVLNKINDSLTK